ncbi:MAG: hypothetical protein IPJ34_43570 [Myxococcales bacterium]|nr:hypothetical protein [Myxococcales bacterium]
MARRSRPEQLSLARTAGWGGRRPGAGRKPRGERPQVPHRPRPVHRAYTPVHLTWRGAAGIGSLRSAAVFPVVVAALSAHRAATTRFRVVHFSVQDDHVHLIVEAHDSASLRAGAQGLGVRLARAVNRALGRRGRVLGDRFHTRALRTPREVRFALIYVLQNFRKHSRLAATRLDPCSSAPWFDGFRELAPLGLERAPVHAPRTWLARVGWRRHGLVSVNDVPVAPS